MPQGVHLKPFIGWNPPAEDSEWARAEAERRGVKLSTILTEALSEYRAKHSRPREDAAPALHFVAAGEPETARRRHAATCKCGMCRPDNGGK